MNYSTIRLWWFDPDSAQDMTLEQVVAWDIIEDEKIAPMVFEEMDYQAMRSAGYLPKRRRWSAWIWEGIR